MYCSKQNNLRRKAALDFDLFTLKQLRDYCCSRLYETIVPLLEPFINEGENQRFSM